MHKSIVRKWGAAVTLALMFALFAATGPVSAQTTIPGGDVSGTWDMAGSPYLIDGEITVPAGATLTIEPGVTVIFQSWYGLAVNGTLLAYGDVSAPILFTAVDGGPGWHGIDIVNTVEPSFLDYVIVEKGRSTGVPPQSRGGGIYVENASPEISNSIIRDNLAKGSGGGLYLENSAARLLNNVIVNNTSGMNGASASGGGITLQNATVELIGNTISGNMVSIAGSYSTPSGLGGGIYMDRSTPIIRNNVITGNWVQGHLNSNARGGAIAFSSSTADLVGNTISGNAAQNESGGVYAVVEGGGIHSYLSTLTIVNTLLWNNAPQEIFVSNQGLSRPLTVAYSDLQGGQAGVVTNDNATLNWQEGNLESDPLFVNAANGDFSLQGASPAIDGGTAFFAWEGRTVVDLAPGEYEGAAPDMGALEAAGTGTNQAPSAVASATPQSGSAPLAVQFSADGSSDPDGTIAAYAWDFGDGAASTEANPTHQYANAGVYNATLIVTDNGGASGSATVTITVEESAANKLHVQAQTVTRQGKGRNVSAVDSVLVADQNGQPIEGVLVIATYSGPSQGEVSDVTGPDGTVSLQTEAAHKPKDAWCFEVTNLLKDGYVYDADANVVTVQCEGG